MYYYVYVLLFFSLCSSLSSASEYDQALLKLTNIERVKHGLNTVQLSQQLTQAAQLHAEDMANNNYFNHTSLDGSSPGDRIQRTGYQYITYAENIIAMLQTPEQVIQKWMNSPGHRANILRPQLTEVGFGYATNSNSRYGRYWVQVFGVPANASSYIHQSEQNLQTENLHWETSQASAVKKALQQHKFILMIAGRDECGNTNSIREQLMNSSDSIKKALQRKYILWYANVDSSTEHFQYTDGLGDRWTLPLVAVIDPKTPTQYIKRITPMNMGTRSSNSSLHQWLQKP